MKKGNVYFDGHYAGTIEEKEDGICIFTYDTHYSQAGGNSISVTLPISKNTHESKKLHGFFDGLIPEGWLLNITKVAFPDLPKDRMDLLLALCHDCIGAVTVHKVTKSGKEDPIQIDKPLVVQSKSTSKRFTRTFKTCLYCLAPLDDSSEPLHPACSMSFFGSEKVPLLEFSVSEIDSLATLNIERKLTVTGAQKKLSLSIESSPQTLNRKRKTYVGTLGNFILKPPPKGCNFMPADEHLIMRLARQLGIKTAECSLIPLATGEICYLTKRFDRVFEKNSLKHRLPMEDFGQIFDRNVDTQKYKESTEQVGRWLRENATIPGADVIRLIEQTYFSYLMGNNDMHLKNLAISTHNDRITLTPAYDLVSTQLIDPDINEEVTLPINGRKNKIRREDWFELARYLGASQKAMENLFLKYEQNFSKIKETIKRSFLPEMKAEELILFAQKKIKKMSSS